MFNIINHGNVCEMRLARPPVDAINLKLVKLLTEAVMNTMIAQLQAKN